MHNPLALTPPTPARAAYLRDGLEGSVGQLEAAANVESSQLPAALGQRAQTRVRDCVAVAQVEAAKLLAVRAERRQRRVRDVAPAQVERVQLAAVVRESNDCAVRDAAGTLEEERAHVGAVLRDRHDREARHLRAQPARRGAAGRSAGGGFR